MRPSNQKLIEDYLGYYKHSPESIKMRKSSLHYFFDEFYFGYKKHVFDLNTRLLKQYFVYLKNYDKVAIATRKNKWYILISFLQSTAEDYESFSITIPTRTIDWKGAIPKATKVKSNAKIIAQRDEIEMILNYFKVRNFKHYIIFRMFAETGMRKGELIDAKIKDINLKYRHINIKIGKTGEKIYNFSSDFLPYLKKYLSSRRTIQTKEESEYLFITKRHKKYGDRGFNLFLKRAIKRLGISKNITTKTFRKTLNTLRKKELGCDKEDAKRLIGHSIQDVNAKNYTIYDYEDLKELYDTYNPYLNCNL